MLERKFKILTNRFGVLSIITGLGIFYFNFDKFVVDGNNNFQQSSLQVISIDLANFIILKKTPKLICIDLREREFYRNAHIACALNLPIGDFEKIVTSDKMFRLNEDDLIFYSNNKNINSIQSITNVLVKLGVREVKFYIGGWSEWKACGMPIEGNAHE